MAPVISALNPAQGPAAGGNEVVIKGTGLLGATAVRFGSKAAGYTVLSNSSIRATATPGTGQVSVTVRTPTGTSNGLTYTYVPAPVVNGLNPGQGPTVGGNQVAILGSGFSGASGVRFGAVGAVFSVVDDSHITATAPAGQGSVPVTVTTAGGTSNGVTYAYITAPAPTVAEVTPQLGPTGGGNTVVITGTNLTGTTAVHFGAAPASGISVQNDSQITVTAPPGANTVTVTVTTPGGTSQSTSGNPYYTYLLQPVITGLIPYTGPASGGTSVAIEGTDLTYTDQVLFGSASAVYAAISDNTLVATAPPGTGAVAVAVHTPGGTSNSLTYTYEA